MSSKTLNHLRVVVHINEDDAVDHNETFRNKTFRCGGRAVLKRNSNDQLPSTSSSKNSVQPLNDNSAYDKMKAEILLVNDKSLQLDLISTENDEGPSTTISHKMHFDHVSDSVVEMLKSEFALVMDELLVKRKNFCIMRFGIKQEMDITIFFDLFITFINKRIYHQKYKLQYVKLECLDMAASLRRSKVPPTETGFQRRANLVYQGDNSDDECIDNSVTYRLPRNAKNEFLSTRDLLIWLLNEYRLKFADSKGHEKLQFSFSIVDHHQNMFKVKFSLFNIFLNLMNAEDRNHWHHYMDHMGEGCQGVDCNFIHSGLTISLSSHIDGIASENALLLFYVPTNNKMTAETIEILQMASSVIKNRTRKLAQTMAQVKNNRALLRASDDCINCLFPQRNEESRNDQPPNNKVRRTLPSTSMSYNINETLLGSFCGKDFHRLSSWYRKIDECFEKTCQLREEYYNNFFKLKLKDISSNIKSLCKSLESLYTNQSENDIIELQKDHIELQDSFERYRSSETLFCQLAKDIKNSNFEQVLKVYLDTKLFELNNSAFRLKQKNLEWCQRHLNYTFDFILTDLKLST